MRPILLHGHERSVTQVKYNREGDLLFSVAKDHHPNVWYSLNGERLGTFEGHTGAVWCVDASWDTTTVVTGAADNTCRVWDCETGRQLGKIDTNTAVRTCGFSFSGQHLMFTTDKQMGYGCKMLFYDVRDPQQMRNGDAATTITIDRPKVTSAIWGPLDDCVITGHEDGALCQWDPKNGEQLVCVREHAKQINDIQPYKDLTMIATASKDTTAKLFDTQSFKHLKTYKTERPVNSASISPIRDHVVLGGGQEAMDVTTTSTRIGKFDARFFHLVFEEEFGRVKGHFGPINSVVFSPDGKSFCSGGEDGYIRIHHFDPHYFDFEVEF